MTMIPRLFALFDLAWRGLSPEERTQLKHSLLKFVGLLLGGGALGGWVIATVLSAGAGVSTLPGATTDPLNVVARAPGTDPAFALNFCNDPATVVTRPRFPVPEQNGALEASRGTDTLTWPGYGVTARYQAPAGGYDVDITPAAVTCLQRKVK